MRFALLRNFVLGWLAFAAGCGHGNDGNVDQGMPMACPSGVEGSSGNNPLPCTPGTSCSDTESTFPVTCQCTCSGYWECDQVLVLCGDGGV